MTIKFAAKEFHCYVSDKIPIDHETIADELNINYLVDMSFRISYYLRSQEDCPFGRGNWIIDFELKNGQLIAFKYPKDISVDDFNKFIKPLIDKCNCEVEIKSKMH